MWIPRLASDTIYLNVYIIYPFLIRKLRWTLDSVFRINPFKCWYELIERIEVHGSTTSTPAYTNRCFLRYQQTNTQI